LSVVGVDALGFGRRSTPSIGPYENAGPLLQCP